MASMPSTNKAVVDGPDNGSASAGSASQQSPTPKMTSASANITTPPPVDQPLDKGFATNGGGTSSGAAAAAGGARQQTTHTLGELHRNVSNQSTIDSGLSRNSHLDMNDPNIRRMFGLASSGSAERQRRLRLLMDQCETVRFPFKKRLILANLNLSHEEIPVDQICSDRLGPALYKLSLAGNRLRSIPESLIVKLTGLRVLDFCQCDLHGVPEEWNLPSLKKLNLSHNRILSCPPEVRDGGHSFLLALLFYE